MVANSWTLAALTTLAASVAAKFPDKDVIDTFYNVVDTSSLLDHKGTNGGIFKGDVDHTTQDKPFGTYNYCFMPHPRADSYEPVEDAELVFVQYVQRHQKRSAYNIFPKGEDTVYKCDQIKPFLYSSNDEYSAHVYADTYTSPTNPFLDTSANGTCQFPQLTIGGFNDGHQHGRDLWSVYGDLMKILPHQPDDTVYLRSTESALTQQTASGVLSGVWPHHNKPIGLKQQSSLVDTINAGFPCDKRDKLMELYQNATEWKNHLQVINPLVEKLDDIAGTKDNEDWHKTMDHFNDNFQARQCNGYDLPEGVSQDEADVIFNSGDWEWNYYYVSQANATEYIQSLEGLFIGEILHDLKSASDGSSKLRFSHVFAHDGDVGPLAGALGIKALRWPGMGSNISIELWKKHGQFYVRVLYCGSPIRSTHGDMTWMPFDQFQQTLAKYVPEDIVGFCSS